MANEVAVSNENASNAIAIAIGGNIDKEQFESLNNVIDNIGNLSGEIDADTRLQGMKYIDDWEDLVLRRIDYKIEKLTDLQRYFNGVCYNNIIYSLNNVVDCDTSYNFNCVYKNFFDDKIVNIIGSLIDPDGENGYLDTIEEICNDINDIEDWCEDNRPENEIVDHRNATPTELVAIQLAYDAACNSYNGQLSKKVVDVKKKLSSLSRSLRKNKNTKNFLKDLAKQIEATKDIKAIAKEKSSIAKMNMVIPNADLRICLKELSVFQQNL